MSLLHLAYIIARRRIASSWRLELVLFLGILLAVTLLSSGVVFSDLLAETALRRALTQASKEEANILVRVFNGLDDPGLTGRRSRYQNSVDFVDRRVTSRFEPYIEDQARHLQTATFFFSGHAQLELENDLRPRGQIQYMTDLQDETRTRLEEGRWPSYNSDADPDDSNRPLEVVLDRRGAELLQLGIDEEMLIFPATGSQGAETLLVKIVGIFSRLNLEDDIWYGREKDFSYQDQRWTLIPLFTTEAGILEKVGGVYPGIYTSVTWVYKLDRSAVRAGDVGRIQQDIRDTRFQIATQLEHGSSTIRLNRVLDEYSERLLLARIPLFLMVFLVTGILAYYLALVASLTIRSRHAEIAMLKSRGATTWQIGLLVLVEGLLLAVPALIVGTLLAPLVGRILGGLFFSVSGEPIPVVLSSQAFLLGAAGAVLAVIVLGASTLVAARRGIVEYRQSGARPPQAPFIHRYYLDFVFLALIGLIWLQIQTRGDFLVRNANTGESTIDFTLLLGPILGLLALGLLVLRFFPLVVVLLARLLEPVGSAWLVQGLRRVSRDPILPGCLVILLMLATALGVIGSAFSSTLDRSQRDRARYEAGADLRIEYTGDRHSVSSMGLSELAEATPNVAFASEAIRVSGYLLTRGFGSGRIFTLGVDTEKFARVAWYRPDFADDQPLENLIDVIRPDAVRNPPLLRPNDGLLLPLEASHLAAWVQLGRASSRLELAARLMDDAGRYFDITLGSLERPGWQRLETELSPVISQGRSGTERALPEIQPPLTLLSLRISSPFGINEPGVIFLDQIIAVGPGGERVLAGFEELTDWQVIEDFTTPGLNALEPSRSVTRNGNRESAAFSWSSAGVGIRSFRPGPPESPIPAIVSPSILEEAGIEIGDTLPLALSNYGVPIRVAAIADYFPTLDPREQPFVVLDQASFIHYSNLHGPRIFGGPNELWGRLSADAPDLTELTAGLEGRGLRIKAIHLSSLLIEERTEQPLTSAGWGGLLVLMFLTLVLASSSGMVLFSYMDTRERQMEFALLRTLGSARRQVNGVVWFNLLLVAVAGIGLGTWAGQLIGITLLPILEISEGGVRVTPPMVFQTNWRILLISYSVLASVFAGTVVWLAWLTGKLDVQRVLRAGEAGA